jgi:hypothetical protein
MRALIFVLALSCAALTGAPAEAQEGHPLKGSWIGTWANNKLLGNDVLVVMNWDGKTISGVINPGTDDIPFKSATLDPDKWTVRIEADAKTKAGVMPIVIEGKLENLAMHNRSIVGTWKSSQGSGAFSIQRQ